MVGKKQFRDSKLGINFFDVQLSKLKPLSTPLDHFSPMIAGYIDVGDGSMEEGGRQLRPWVPVGHW